MRRSRRIELIASSGHKEIERQLDTDTFFFGLFIYQPVRRGELDTHPGVVFKQRDFPLVFSAAAFPPHELAKLVEIFELDHAALDALGELRLLSDDELRLVPPHYESRAADRLVVELAALHV